MNGWRMKYRYGVWEARSERDAAMHGHAKVVNKRVWCGDGHIGTWEGDGTDGVSGREMDMEERHCGEERESVMASMHGYEMK